MTNTGIVTAFIERIWNQRAFDELDSFLHPDYRDLSLPSAVPANAAGTLQWIVNTGTSFEHRTVIDELISDRDSCVIRISMHLKHVGSWRDIDATGIEILTRGYRQFKLSGGGIIEHRALIDGQAIENALSEAAKGCSIK